MRTIRFCSSGGVGYLGVYPQPPGIPYPLEGTLDQRYPTPKRDFGTSDTLRSAL